MFKKRKEYVGEVIRDGAPKTVVVAVARMVQNKRFKKYVRRTTLLMAHDAENACHVGDFVKLIETRPISARKRWKVLEILKKAKRAEER